MVKRAPRQSFMTRETACLTIDSVQWTCSEWVVMHRRVYVSTARNTFRLTSVPLTRGQMLPRTPTL